MSKGNLAIQALDMSKMRTTKLFLSFVCLQLCFGLTVQCQTLSKNDLAEFQWDFNAQRKLNQAASAYGFGVMKTTYMKLSKNMDLFDIMASLENIGDDTKLFDEFIYQVVLSAGGGKDYSRTILYSLCASYRLANTLFNYVQSKYGERLLIDLKEVKESAERERIENEKEQKLEEKKEKARVAEETKKEDEENRIYDAVDVEATFPGGDSAWRKYLDSTWNGENIFGPPEGTYTIVIQFVVDKEGNIGDVRALTTHGYGMEDEAIKVIRRGPKWIPAILRGKKVKTYRKQSITFRVAGE